MGQAVHSEHRRNLENSRAKPKMWLVRCVVWVDIAVASVVCGVGTLPRKGHATGVGVLLRLF